jgi:hypothetical protein
MNKRRLVLSVAAATGLCFLIAVPGLAETQSNQVNPTIAPSNSPPADGTRKVIRPDDDLAGLTLTDAQKAKIDQIRQNMKARMDAVAKDEKENEDQKDAMLDGLQHMELRQVLQVLTPVQLSEVRKKVMIRRAAEQEQNKVQQGASPR